MQKYGDSRFPMIQYYATFVVDMVLNIILFDENRHRNCLFYHVALIIFYC